MKNTLLLTLLLFVTQPALGTTYTMISDGSFYDSSKWDVFPDLDNLTTNDTIRINTYSANNVSFPDFSVDLGALIFGPMSSHISGWNLYLDDTDLIVESEFYLDLWYSDFDVSYMYGTNSDPTVTFFVFEQNSHVFLNSDLEVDLYILNSGSLEVSFFDTFDNIINEGLLLVSDPFLYVNHELGNCGEIRNTSSSNTDLHIECHNFTQEYCNGAGSITGFQNVFFNCPNSYITNLTIDP